MPISKIHTLLLCLFSFALSAQETPEQVIRGTLTDALTGKALVGASILLPGTMPVKGTTTDDNGKYRLENIPVGRYNVEATYIGYELLYVPGVLVESGKEVILHLSLYEETADLNEVVVKSKRRQGTALSPVSVQSITAEEVLRFPATFNDPARLALSYPGVVNTNDQANHLSVRGNSPNSTSWRLEGAEIVNPNHLGDAGTSDGRPSISGGGVNILSAQLLGNSNFYSSVFPVEYGNAIGGIMDMRFRNGNDEKQEYTVQAGLVGFDFSAEGPLSKSKGISYLVNYRYSFVGLLTALGADFGGEAISFQDVAFNVKIPLDKHSVLKVFGMGGISENVFTGKDDPEEWEVDKDRLNIDFTNRMGALGASYSSVLGERASLKATLVGSALRTNKRNDRINQNSPPQIAYTYDSLSYSKLAFQSEFVYKLIKRHSINVGFSAINHDFTANTEGYFGLMSDGSGSGWLQSIYTKWIWKPISPLSITIGLHHTYFTYTNSRSIEPRGNINWQATRNDRFSFAYGLHSQIQAPQVYLAREFAFTEQLNRNLDFSKSHHFVLGYNRELGTRSTFTAELYYQSLFNIPTTNGSSFIGVPNLNFSAINLLGDFKSYELFNDGTGRNYGLELSYRRFIQDDYYILANTSFYRSKFTGIASQEWSSRFDGKYLFNLTGGKEFNWQYKGQKKGLGINARLTYAGGLRRTSIYLDNNSLPAENNDSPFSEKQKDYFKADFRIYLKNNKAKYNTTFAMDLQNLTNRKNDGYYYYDHIQQKVLVQKQLGLIPNLSYRVEF